MGAASVQFKCVSKRFRLGVPHGPMSWLADLASGAARRIHKHDDAEFWALRDVDFLAEPGEAIGIIGPNGAGKSTALKLLAGILRPDRGLVEVRGRMAALIEVGAGFHGDLTGRENIFLNGALMGMRRVEVQAKLDAIVSFAGLERFLDMPVKRYSSGMYARLGFAVAAHVEPEILLVDEVLSVGDAVFRLRCLEHMRRLIQSGTMLIFVTHNLDQMQSICARAIVLDDGRAVFDGGARDAVGHYLTAMSQVHRARPTDIALGDCDGGKAAELLEMQVSDQAGRPVQWIRSGDGVRLVLTLRLPRPIGRLVLETNLRAAVGDNLLSFNSARGGREWCLESGIHEIELDIPALPLAGGQYFWNVRLWDAARGTTELDTPFRFPMSVDDSGRSTGLLSLEHRWRETATQGRGCAAQQAQDSPALVHS